MHITSIIRLRHSAIAIALGFASVSYAADFTITSGTVDTTPRTLNDNETGTIDSGGQLNTATTAITASGVNNTVSNNGASQQQETLLTVLSQAALMPPSAITAVFQQ